MQKVLGNFIIFSLIIVLLAGVYIWLANRQQVTSLDYIQDMDWSEWQSISPAIQSTGIYDGMVDRHGHLHLIWLEYSVEEQAGQLFHTEVNADGNVLQDPEVILTNRRLFDVSLIFQQNRIHLFWFGEGPDGLLSLMYSEFDHDGNQLAERKVISGEFTWVEGLQAVMAPNGEFMLAWVDELNNVKQVQVLWLDAAMVPKSEPQQITWIENGADCPNIAVDTTGTYHLVWLEKYTPSKNLGVKDHNYYRLNYQIFDASGEPVNVPQMLDNVVLSMPVLAVTNDRLYITWNKVLPYKKVGASSLEQVLPKYRVLGMAVELTDPIKLGPIKDLTGDGVAFNQSLAVDSVGQIHMVYYRLTNDRLVLAQETFTKGFAGIKPPTQIFPNQEIFFGEEQLKLKYGSMLLPDMTKGVHLVWFNSSSVEGDRFYYSNTIRPVTISPLQVIGIDKQRLTASLVMSLMFTIGLSILGVFGFTWIFTLVAAALLSWVTRFEKKLPWFSYLKNPFIATAVLCLANYFFTLLRWQQSYFWQGFYGWGYLGAIFIIATGAAAIFVFLNRNHTRPIILAGATSLFWIYWLNVVSLMFVIPGMVF